MKTLSEELVYGIRSVEELLKDTANIHRIEKILVDEKKHRTLSSLLNKAREHRISVQYVPSEKIEKLAKGKNHQGILAHLIHIHYTSTTDLLNRSDNRLLLFLDRITDVRNFGAIARSAYAMGVDALIIPSKDTASINADAIKTSAGALLKIPVCKEQNITQLLTELKAKGFQIIACHEKTSKRIYEIHYKHPTVLILGSEHNGIRKEYLKLCDHEVKIPMSTALDSLNVSVATGIILYEIVRQQEMYNDSL